jgi:hypothetical protein
MLRDRGQEQELDQAVQVDEVSRREGFRNLDRAFGLAPFLDLARVHRGRVGSVPFIDLKLESFAGLSSLP